MHLAGSRHEYRERGTWPFLCAGLILTGALAAAPGAASAQVVTCDVSNSTASFGSYNPILANATVPLDGVWAISYHCSCSPWLWCLLFPQAVGLRIDLGTGHSLSFHPRQMGRTGTPAERLNYNFFRDAARQAVWGDGTGGTSYFSTSFSVGSKPVNANASVYGRVDAGQNASTGDYSDQVFITASY